MGASGKETQGLETEATVTQLEMPDPDTQGPPLPHLQICVHLAPFLFIFFGAGPEGD